MGMAAGGALAACQPRRGPWATDVAQVDRTRLGARVRARSLLDVQHAFSQWDGQVCVAGGRYSMGGQTRMPGALQLDMTGMNQVLWVDVERQVVRVQAGIRWRQLQAILDPMDLSVRVMQSYSNFTVGGSVSVNCHGRYVGGGAIINTVRAIALVLPDGQAMEVTRTAHPEVFAAVVGGYGGLGVITEVELDLATNTKMARKVEWVGLDDYPQWFQENLLGASGAIMHNADLLPPRLDAPLSISWFDTQEPLTDHTRLTAVGHSYAQEQNMIWAASELKSGAALRKRFLTDKIASTPRVVWRNLEASLDTASLEPRTRVMSTYLLQEYFIPVAAFSSFAKVLRQVLVEFDVNILNVSLRHAPADTGSVLTWASEDVFCFVLYIKQRNFPWVHEAAGKWTSKLVDAAIDHGGRYYLPYRPHARVDQFRRAYPGADEWLELKHTLDPDRRLDNIFLSNYL